MANSGWQGSPPLAANPSQRPRRDDQLGFPNTSRIDSDGKLERVAAAQRQSVAERRFRQPPSGSLITSSSPTDSDSDLSAVRVASAATAGALPHDRPLRPRRVPTPTPNMARKAGARPPESV